MDSGPGPAAFWEARRSPQAPEPGPRSVRSDGRDGTVSRKPGSYQHPPPWSGIWSNSNTHQQRQWTTLFNIRHSFGTFACLLASHFCPSARPLHNALSGLARTHGRVGVIGCCWGASWGRGGQIRECRLRIIPHSHITAVQAFPDTLACLGNLVGLLAAAPVSAALPRTPAVEEMRTIDSHTEAVCGGFDQGFCRRHNHHISCRGHGAVRTNRRCRAVFLMTRPRCRRRVRT